MPVNRSIWHRAGFSTTCSANQMWLFDLGLDESYHTDLVLLISL